MECLFEKIQSYLTFLNIYVYIESVSLLGSTSLVALQEYTKYFS